MAINLFDVQYPDEKEHFLATMILEFLKWGESPKDKDGFTTTKNIIDEMQSWGFTSQQIEGKLRRLTNKKLIESAEKVTFEEEDSIGLIGDMPFVFRITSVGAYHTMKWMNTFAYLDAMVFDTGSSLKSGQWLSITFHTPPDFCCQEQNESSLYYKTPQYNQNTLFLSLLNQAFLSLSFLSIQFSMS